MSQFTLIKLVFITLLCITLRPLVFGQKEANNWYFGDNAGLDFNSNNPSPLTGSGMRSHGGSTARSDAQSGELQFYSNGEKVWNRNHEMMLNGDDLLGTNTADQNALVVPVPGNTTAFYLFTIKAIYENGLASNLYYSIIDMTLDNGLGSVTTKNELVMTNITESQIGVKNKRENGYWLVVHQANSDVFFSIEVTASGIGVPIAQSVGTVYAVDRFNNDGELKFSPDGTMIAGGQGSSERSSIELYDFDSSTGLISNFREIATLSSHYGTSFSPDNTKLYVSGIDTEYLETSGDIGDYIYQFDLSNPETEAIKNSKLPLFSAGNTVTNIGKMAIPLASGMQIGPDGRVYAAGNITVQDETGSLTKIARNALIVIERPNAKGFDCYVTLKFFDFGQGQVLPGLPNFTQEIFNNRLPQEEQQPCGNEQAYAVFPNPAKSSFKIKVLQDCFEPYAFTIYNGLGQLVLAQYVSKKDSDDIDIRFLSDGMYLVHLSISNRTVLKKIIIKK